MPYRSSYDAGSVNRVDSKQVSLHFVTLLQNLGGLL